MSCPASLRKALLSFSILAAFTLAAGELAAQREGVTRGDDGKSYTAEGTPTYHVAEDGTVDWYIYQGFRRYHSECHVCHGPDGAGSTYAPALAKSAIRMDYYNFVDVVVNGKSGPSEAEVMPAFGLNHNVMCYLDDIYIYLK